MTSIKLLHVSASGCHHQGWHPKGGKISEHLVLLASFCRHQNMLWCCRQGLISGNVRKPFLSPLSQSVCCSANSFLIAALSVGLLFSQFLSYRRSLSRSAVQPVPFLSPLSQSVCCSASSFLIAALSVGLLFSQFLLRR